MEYDSDHHSLEEGNPHLPMLDYDLVFGGESRIDMEMSFTLTEPPPEGPPSSQTIYLADEDSTVRFIDYKAIPWLDVSVLEVGLLPHCWYPRFIRSLIPESMA
jgi:cation-transporting ATPase 13A3/4/5